MAWRIEFDAEASKEFRKLDHTAQRAIAKYFRERIATDEDPCRFGRTLRGEKTGLWRYRVADYRLICRIEAERLVVVVLVVGHRRNVYDR